MKRLAILLVFAVAGCSSTPDAQTVAFLGDVNEMANENTAYILHDSTISEDTAKERLLRNQALQKRVALILGTQEAPK